VKKIIDKEIKILEGVILEINEFKEQKSLNHQNFNSVVTRIDNSLFLLHRLLGEKDAFEILESILTIPETIILEKHVRKNTSFYNALTWYFEII